MSGSVVKALTQRLDRLVRLAVLLLILAGATGSLAEESAAQTGGKIYWTDIGTQKIQRANLDGSGIEDLVTAELRYPSSIALDVAGGKMYWTDLLAHKIQRANLDGSGIEDLVTAELLEPSSIALDVAGGTMYWTDWHAQKIQRANLDGSGVQDLLTTTRTPTSIALDVAGGKMYWVNFDRREIKIQRGNLDGSSVQDLIGLSGTAHIALDVAGGKMYWTEGDYTIKRANLDGSGVQNLVDTGNGPEDLALDIAGGTMYWTEAGALPVGGTAPKIRRANLDGTGAKDRITTALSQPIGIALDRAAKRPPGLPPPVPVIFIHGLNGSKDSWTGLSQFLTGRAGWTFGGFPTADGPIGPPLTAGDFYVLQFRDNQNGFAKQGPELDTVVTDVLAVNPNAAKVILVGHSMGGLAARWYIEILGGGPRVAGLVTVGTPHRGAEVAAFCIAAPDVCSYFGIDPVSEVVVELMPKSVALRALNSHLPLPQDIVYTSLIGTGRDVLPDRVFDGDGIVTQRSQNLAKIKGAFGAGTFHEEKALTIDSCHGSLWPETHTCETKDIGVWTQILHAINTLPQVRR